MVELLSRLSPADLAAVLIVPAIGLVVGVVAVAALVIKGIQKYREREIALTVVTELLDRGVSPQDVVAILKAMGINSPRERRSRLHELLKTAAQPTP